MSSSFAKLVKHCFKRRLAGRAKGAIDLHGSAQLVDQLLNAAINLALRQSAKHVEGLARVSISGERGTLGGKHRCIEPVVVTDFPGPY